jgi:hypothetical protein
MPRGKAAKMIALIGAIHDVLGPIQPASVRAVCYKLFVLGSMRICRRRRRTASAAP